MWGWLDIHFPVDRILSLEALLDSCESIVGKRNAPIVPLWKRVVNLYILQLVNRVPFSLGEKNRESECTNYSEKCNIGIKLLA